MIKQFHNHEYINNEYINNNCNTTGALLHFFLQLQTLFNIATLDQSNLQRPKYTNSRLITIYLYLKIHFVLKNDMWYFHLRSNIVNIPHKLWGCFWALLRLSRIISIMSMKVCVYMYNLYNKHTVRKRTEREKHKT